MYQKQIQQDLYLPLLHLLRSLCIASYLAVGTGAIGYLSAIVADAKGFCLALI